MSSPSSNVCWRIHFLLRQKCEFHVTSLSFLGYIIVQNRTEMDPAKVSAIDSWPIPDSRKELQ